MFNHIYNAKAIECLRLTGSSKYSTMFKNDKSYCQYSNTFPATAQISFNDITLIAKLILMNMKNKKT